MSSYRLKGASGAVINQSFTIGEQTVIGRADDCDLRLDQPVLLAPENDLNVGVTLLRGPARAVEHFRHGLGAPDLGDLARKDSLQLVGQTLLKLAQHLGRDEARRADDDRLLARLAGWEGS